MVNLSMKDLRLVSVICGVFGILACVWIIGGRCTRKGANSAIDSLEFLEHPVISHSSAAVGESIEARNETPRNSRIPTGTNPPVEIPPHIQSILTNRFFRREDLAQVKPIDESTLLTLYSREVALTNQTKLLGALAIVGGDSAAQVLSAKLIENYGNRTIDQAEVDNPRLAITTLGFIATRTDRARDFLRQAMSEDFWKEHRTWHVLRKDADDYTNLRFANLAITALGCSGWSDFEDMLDNWRHMDPSTLDRGTTAAISDAAFFYQYGQEHGFEKVIDLRLGFGPASTYELFNKWVDTENGSNWHAWARLGTR